MCRKKLVMIVCGCACLCIGLKLADNSIYFAQDADKVVEKNFVSEDVVEKNFDDQMVQKILGWFRCEDVQVEDAGMLDMLKSKLKVIKENLNSELSKQNAFSKLFSRDKGSELILKVEGLLRRLENWKDLNLKRPENKKLTNETFDELKKACKDLEVAICGLKNSKLCGQKEELRYILERSRRLAFVFDSQSERGQKFLCEFSESIKQGKRKLIEDDKLLAEMRRPSDKYDALSRFRARYCSGYASSYKDVVCNYEELARGGYRNLLEHMTVEDLSSVEESSYYDKNGDNNPFRVYKYTLKLTDNTLLKLLKEYYLGLSSDEYSRGILETIVKNSGEDVGLDSISRTSYKWFISFSGNVVDNINRVNKLMENSANSEARYCFLKNLTLDTLKLSEDDLSKRYQQVVRAYEILDILKTTNRDKDFTKEDLLLTRVLYDRDFDETRESYIKTIEEALPLLVKQENAGQGECDEKIKNVLGLLDEIEGMRKKVLANSEITTALLSKESFDDLSCEDKELVKNTKFLAHLFLGTGTEESYRNRNRFITWLKVRKAKEVIRERGLKEIKGEECRNLKDVVNKELPVTGEDFTEFLNLFYNGEMEQYVNEFIHLDLEGKQDESIGFDEWLVGRAWDDENGLKKLFKKPTPYLNINITRNGALHPMWGENREYVAESEFKELLEKHKKEFGFDLDYNKEFYDQIFKEVRESLKKSGYRARGTPGRIVTFLRGKNGFNIGEGWDCGTRTHDPSFFYVPTQDDIEAFKTLEKLVDNGEGEWPKGNWRIGGKLEFKELIDGLKTLKNYVDKNVLVIQGKGGELWDECGCLVSNLKKSDILRGKIDEFVERLENNEEPNSEEKKKFGELLKDYTELSVLFNDEKSEKLRYFVFDFELWQCNCNNENGMKKFIEEIKEFDKDPERFYRKAKNCPVIDHMVRGDNFAEYLVWLNTKFHRDISTGGSGNRQWWPFNSSNKSSYFGYPYTFSKYSYFLAEMGYNGQDAMKDKELFKKVKQKVKDVGRENILNNGFKINKDLICGC